MDGIIDGLIQGVGAKTAKKMKNTVTGGVEHAVIAICDLRDKDVREEENQAAGTGGAFESLSAIASGVTDKIKAFAEEHAPSVTAMIGKMIDGSDMGEDVKKYEVQFNPASFTLEAGVAEDESKMSVDEKKTQLEYGSNEINVVMSVKLIFDETDAILPQHAVQKQVEGFMSAIGNESTRALLFMWGNMCYEGILEKLDGKYTMFDATGMPIRAEVDLSINCCAISQTKAATAQRPMGVWQEAYDQFMGSLNTTNNSGNDGAEQSGLFHFLE